ncbi:MAG: BlaI/MecI/CopY family transcriptional regulator [Propionibacteriaceae bacterium]|nr:BlaI/MecI/CopY family transcriptional regulator [Propionibacteriaceae bacterium]
MTGLGELETRVMDVLWLVQAPISVRAVHTELARERDLAYTTVLTVLDRLTKKSLVSRVRHGRLWLYSAEYSREDLVARRVLDLLGTEPQARRAALAEVIGRLPQSDRGALIELLTRTAS